MDGTLPRRAFFSKNVVDGSSGKEKLPIKTDNGLREPFPAKFAVKNGDIDLDSDHNGELSCIRHVWNHTAHKCLPDWLQDNDYLCEGHRPQIQSFKECFKSIFRIHSETGNIWTHLLGTVIFLGIAAKDLSSDQLSAADKWAFALLFTGPVLCMGLSFVYHTVSCYSPFVGRLFGKLDHCGIAFVIFGSIVPWLHFGFYCRATAKMIYIAMIGSLSLATIIVALWDKFGQPSFRTVRACVFVGLGLTGAVPCIHYVIADGWQRSLEEAALHWMLLMAVCHIFGTALYACRIPERWFPGKCDIWFQSHQIFHVLVFLACYIHYYGISLMASHRSSLGQCPPLPSSRGTRPMHFVRKDQSQVGEDQTVMQQVARW